MQHDTLHTTTHQIPLQTQSSTHFPILSAACSTSQRRPHTDSGTSPPKSNMLLDSTRTSSYHPDPFPIYGMSMIQAASSSHSHSSGGCFRSPHPSTYGLYGFPQTNAFHHACSPSLSSRRCSSPHPTQDRTTKHRFRPPQTHMDSCCNAAHSHVAHIHTSVVQGSTCSSHTACTQHRSTQHHTCTCEPHCCPMIHQT